MNRIGVDIGGTKLEAVVLTPDGAELGRRRALTPAGNYRAIIDTVSELVDEVESFGNPTYETVGVGHPGAVSPLTGRIKNSNSTALNGQPLPQDLRASLGRPVILRNDANCFALSEARDGAGVGKPVVFGVIIGTGVGGGLVVNNEIITGPNAIAGEWGHNPLPWPRPDELPGPHCYCGLRGCIETFLSGPGLSAQDHSNRSAPEIVAAARSGETRATAKLADYFDRMARSLATVLNVLDPDVVVLGGGMSNIDEIYEEIPNRWSEYVFSDAVTTQLVKNRHGDSSGVRGAAWLVADG